MTEAEHSIEERILQAVKLTLACVIRDTATPQGMRHPLSDGTIQDLRQCLALISARERELAQAAGMSMNSRPHYADEAASEDTVIHFHRKKPSGNESQDS
ncbi:MAG: segregation and condensation protein A [Casimicrobiaceae bacterium]